MKLNVTVVRMGGGYLKAVFGQSRETLTGDWVPDSVFGQDEEELLERLKTRLPAFRNSLKAVVLRGGRTG